MSVSELEKACAVLLRVNTWFEVHYIVTRAICLTFWLGAPVLSYFTGGPIKLLGYFVVLGGYCLLRESWRIVWGDV